MWRQAQGMTQKGEAEKDKAVATFRERQLNAGLVEMVPGKPANKGRRMHRLRMPLATPCSPSLGRCVRSLVR